MATTDQDPPSAVPAKDDDQSKREDKQAEEGHNENTNHAEEDGTAQKTNGQKDGEAQQANGQESKPDQQNGDKPHGAERAGTGIGEIKDKITDKKRRIQDKTKPPGGFDKTPLPDVPPGWTVKITFHKAENLPAADIKSSSSDPYVHATLTTSLPERHEDDPPLSHRTRTLHKTREPEWEEEWIVANIPSSGFTLKCRLYDEDSNDHDDRLGNVTVHVPHVGEDWKGLGPEGEVFNVKKRMGSKRAYFFRAIHSGIRHHVTMTPRLHLSIDLVGRSEGPGAHTYTVGPTRSIKHFSPMIGRLAGTKVNEDEKKDMEANENPDESKTKKFDFQANEIQLSGPVPPKLYHRYVEFRPVIGMMFSNHGVRGWILNKALHKQHNRIYHYTPSTEYEDFEACSKEASLQLLKMAHFDEGGRIFTYVLTLDGLLRFTETGKEFGIDLLSKHTMHSDVATYIACSGEFFIRRLQRKAPESERDDPEPPMATHPQDDLPGGPPDEAPPSDPAQYQLIIDNDSGTYRPDKSILPDLKAFLERNFPGLGIVVMHCGDEELDKLKKAQAEAKKREGKSVNMVLNRRPSASSISSSDESRLSDMEEEGQDDEAGATAHNGAEHDLSRGKLGAKSKKEAAYEVLEDPKRVKGLVS